ncbi:hypothetical protein [uncultured Nostoc sp.]|uniref:hypothetical protein n=1 Tax=uncultured Nostoc sp. TaxID=340711 RepID=UPI0035CA4B30
MTCWNLLLTGLGVEVEEFGLDVVWGLLVVLAGVRAVWDVGAEVAAFSGDDDESVVVAEFVAASGVALVKTEAAEEVGEDVKKSAADVGDAEVASVGVEAADVCCVALVEAPLGLRLTCR